RPRSEPAAPRPGGGPLGGVRGRDAEPAGYRESRAMLAPTGRRREDPPRSRRRLRHRPLPFTNHAVWKVGATPGASWHQVFGVAFFMNVHGEWFRLRRPGGVPGGMARCGHGGAAVRTSGRRPALRTPRLRRVLAALYFRPGHPRLRLRRSGEGAVHEKCSEANVASFGVR